MPPFRVHTAVAVGPENLAPRERAPFPLSPAASQLPSQPVASADPPQMPRPKFNQVGILLLTPGIEFTFPPTILSGIHEAVQNRGLHLIYLDVRMAEIGQELPKAISEARVDGLVVANLGALSVELMHHMEGLALPKIFFNHRQATNCVYVDDILGAEQITDHLIQQGYRHIGLVQDFAPSRQNHYSNLDRRSGYLNAMHRAGLQPDIRLLYTEEAIADYLTAPECPEAVFCHYDRLAIKVQRTALKVGKRIPQDLAVVGANNDDAAIWAPVPLTTVHVPWREMGVAAGRALCRLVDSPRWDELIPAIVLKPSLQIRSSASKLV